MSKPVPGIVNSVCDEIFDIYFFCFLGYMMLSANSRIQICSGHSFEDLVIFKANPALLITSKYARALRRINF
jgi:hypothetical protein